MSRTIEAIREEAIDAIRRGTYEPDLIDRLEAECMQAMGILPHHLKVIRGEDAALDHRYDFGPAQIERPPGMLIVNWEHPETTMAFAQCANPGGSRTAI